MGKLEVYWIDGPSRGRLGIMPRPRGGDGLAGDIETLGKLGANVLVSLLMSEEAAEVKLEGEAAACAANRIEFLSFPVVDHSVPEDAGKTREIARALVRHLQEGRGVVIHCWMGIGRSALLAACVLVNQGLGTEIAFKKIAAARWAPVPDTNEQRAWVAEFERTVR